MKIIKEKKETLRIERLKVASIHLVDLPSNWFSRGRFYATYADFKKITTCNIEA
jgi:hypothetical protein